ncbi:MAG: S8 family serine peptidase [Flavobacteriales bacterium]
MKTTRLLLALFFGIFTSSMYAQSVKVWAQITEAQAIPTQRTDGTWFSSNPALQQALQSLHISAVKAALPASRQPKLQRVFEFEAPTTLEALKAGLSTVSVIEGIENAPSYQTLYTPNDYNMNVPTDYALNLIHAQGAWDVTHGNSSVVLGISDQNINPLHTELQGKIVHYNASNTTIATHGNAVCVLAAGNTDNNNGLSAIGFNSTIAFYQMNYNEILVASYGGIRVINTSWTSGCFFNQYEQDAVTEAYGNGTMIIAAAGNGNTCGSPDALVYPAAYAHVFAVTSIGPNDNHEQYPGDLNTTHQHNQMVDLSAPGYDVAIAPLDSWYLTGSGTSYAAPLVTGTVGLMLAVNPCLSVDNIETILKASSTNIDGLNPLYAGKIGAGRLNAANAVLAAQSFNAYAQFNTQILAVCEASTSTVNVNPIGVAEPFSLVWSNGMTGTQNSGLTAGTYTIVLTDANGCTSDTTFTLTTPTNVQVNGVVTQVQCFGQTTGAIDVSVVQGSPSFAYFWDNGATTEDLNNLAAGTYRLTVVDGNGCKSFTSYLVTEPTELVLTTTVTDVTNGNNGAIDLSINGGTPSYIIAWSNGAITEDQINLIPGTYTATVFDGNGCVNTTTVTVADFTVSGIEEQEAGKVIVYPNPSQGNANITWEGNMMDLMILDNNGRLIANSNIEGTSSYVVQGLGTGTYMVRINGANGITATQRIVVL